MLKFVLFLVDSDEKHAVDIARFFVETYEMSLCISHSLRLTLIMKITLSFFSRNAGGIYYYLNWRRD